MARRTTIQFWRGNRAELPQIAARGMPLWCEDTLQLYIGTGDGRVLLATGQPDDDGGGTTPPATDTDLATLAGAGLYALDGSGLTTLDTGALAPQSNLYTLAGLPVATLAGNGLTYAGA